MEIVRGSNGDILHVVVRFDKDFGEDTRVDISDASEFLQLGIISGPKGRSYPPHIHLTREASASDYRTQESWVVIRGKVAVDFFDDEGSLIDRKVLEAGDVSLTFRGGHGYQLMDQALVYEFKTGPYLGQVKDKRFI